MTKSKPPEARWLNEDYPVVIMYAHISAEEAMKIAEHDIGDIDCDYGKITSVIHGWVKYQKVGEDDLPMCEDGIEEGDTVLTITEKSERPRGVVSRVTIPVFEGFA